MRRGGGSWYARKVEQLNTLSLVEVPATHQPLSLKICREGSPFDGEDTLVEVPVGKLAEKARGHVERAVVASGALVGDVGIERVAVVSVRDGEPLGLCQFWFICSDGKAHLATVCTVVLLVLG